MSMLRNLLTDRFKLTFHREEKMFSIYELQVAKNGPKLKASAAPPDETQFGGEVPPASAEARAAPLFSAIQQQLGLRLEATRGPVQALVVDRAERPSAN
jgi:hypothetical protein